MIPVNIFFLTDLGIVMDKIQFHFPCLPRVGEKIIFPAGSFEFNKYEEPSFRVLSVDYILNNDEVRPEITVQKIV